MSSYLLLVSFLTTWEREKAERKGWKIDFILRVMGNRCSKQGSDMT